MPTENGAKPETWRDWLPAGGPEPDRLYTRDQVLDLARGMRAEVSTSDIRYWEQVGVLPRPVRRWHEGAVRAVYPLLIAYLIKELRRLQRYEGLSLAEARPRLRTYARMWLTYDAAYAQRDRVPEDLSLGPNLAGELERLANEWAELAGVPVDRVEVHVIGTSGRATKYPLPIAPFPDDRPPSDS